MRIAIVNDMRMAVEALRRVVTSVPAYEVAWIAEDGEDAVRKCAADVPDVILMDLNMPRMDGAEASRRIMSDSPCAILVVTATVEGNSSKVFQAMGWGALDAVNTPVLGMSGEPAGATALLAKLSMLGKLLGKARPLSRMAAAKAAATKPATGPDFPLVAIGSSTGGPTALARVLAGLPLGLKTAVAIVQHIDEHFAPGLASWLAGQVGRDVRVIQPNEALGVSHVHLASTNDHLILNADLTFAYTADPADFPYRPSVDVFLRTVAKSWAGAAVGVLLTGMGADGAQGLLAMRQNGWHTIAQDQESSVVYGMPKAAAQINAASEVLPVDKIGEGIARALAREAQAAQRRHS